ncbi:MAG TPA: hypothetical protein VKP30_29025 [Polyangiaceae bacterium]|nr:hypothetical protein [Polyangiaceae bacterium]
MPILGYFLVVQQHKFWDYHSIVVASLTLVLAAYLASLLLPRLPRDRRLAMLGLLATALLVALGSIFPVRGRLFQDWRSDSGEMAMVLKLARRFGEARNVLYYSTSIYHMRLAYSLDQRIVGKKCHDFDYPAIVRDRDQQRRSHRIQMFCEEQTKLVLRALPDAIVFLDTGQGLEGREQAEHSLLVEQCKVVPEQLYGHVPLPGISQVHLYYLRQGR